MPNETISARAHTLLQQTLLGDGAEHARVGVVVWNEERRYVAANQFACELLGVSREVLLDAQVGDQNRTADGREAIESILDRVPAQGRTTIAGAGEVDWLVVATRLAGLPHFLGLMWPVAS